MRKKIVTYGKFITIEGQDGAGKTTNMAVVEKYLTNQGIDFIRSREPGGTPFGESIRTLLLNSKDNSIGDLSELLLVFAARAQHIEAVIRPALEKGQWVLCDRFTDATYAYQGGGRDLGFEKIAALETLVQGELRPDLTLLLDLPVEVGESRAGQRSEPDRFEIQKTNFKSKVRQSYLRIANEEPQRMKIVDASQNISVVETQIAHVLSEFIAGNQ